MHSDSFDLRFTLSFKSILFLVLGSLFATLAIKGFMIPNQFLDGGITGISILSHEIFHIDVSIPLVLLNLPFIYIGYKKVGKSFALYSVTAVLLLALFLQFVPVPTVTNDKILIAVFGGFFIGLGIGFIIRAGGVIDGLEVIAEYTTKKSGFSASEIIMAINTLIFLTAAYEFGIEKAMYSILTYFTALQVFGYVVDGIEQYTAITVISGESEKIKAMLVNDFDKAISVFKGERGYLPGSFDVHEECDIVLAVVTRLEIYKLREAIFEIDPMAFVYIQSLKEVEGGKIKKIRAH